MRVLFSIILMTLLASPYLCDGASSKVRLDDVKVEVLSKQGVVLDTYEYKNDMLKMDVRGSATVKVYFNVLEGSGGVIEPDQASLIVSKKQQTGKNVVSFASVKSGKMVGMFDWSIWENQFGTIRDGETFELSVVVGSSSPARAFQTTLAALVYLSGPKPTLAPGQVPVTARIAKTVSSISMMPEIAHQFRPEEKMVAAPVSLAFAALMFAPVIFSIGLMIKSGANLKGLREFHGSARVIASMFHLGTAIIIVIQLAFWLKFNLVQILPVLVPVQLITLALGIKLSAMATAGSKSVATSTDTTTTVSKKNL